MNAAIRATVRAGIHYDCRMYGIFDGYQGMIEGHFEEINELTVSNIIQKGGTILRSARSKEFMTVEGRQRAYDQMKKNGIDAFVVIGGDGSFTGAHLFYQEFGLPYVCLPGTIDNDLNGTDFTIGFDTATNTAVDNIDKIRDTALSHNRIFFIECMGRHAGDLAIRSGIAGGAVSVLVPEEEDDIDLLVQKLQKSSENRQKSSLVVVAEGGKPGRSFKIAKQVGKQLQKYETKVIVLGHIQRGGSPTVYDRVMASRMGVGAIEGLLDNKKDMLVGVVNRQVVFTTFDEVMAKPHKYSPELIRVAKILSI